MSKFKEISSLRRELNDINAQIDTCIVRGKSYDRLASKHKSIVAKIDRMYNEMNFARTFRFLSLL